jgi:hypothetical protein
VIEKKALDKIFQKHSSDLSTRVKLVV